MSRDKETSRVSRKEKKELKKELKQEKKELKQENKEVKKKEAKAKFQADLLLRLQACLMFPKNNVCSECPERNPTMAVLLLPPPNCNHKSIFGSSSKGTSKADKKAIKEEKRKLMGVFCCKRCSSYFMEQGRDVCEVKNIKMPDQWTEGTVSAVELSGNRVVNAIYEANYNTSLLGDYDNIASSCDPRCAPFVHRKYTECDFFCLESYKQYWKCRLNPKKYGTVMSFVATHHRSARSRNNSSSPSPTTVIDSTSCHSTGKIGVQQAPFQRSTSDPLSLLSYYDDDDEDEDSNGDEVKSSSDDSNNSSNNNNAMNRVRQNRAARTSMSMITQQTDEPNPAEEEDLGYGDNNEKKKEIELQGLGKEEQGTDSAAALWNSTSNLDELRGASTHTSSRHHCPRSRASISMRRSRSIELGIPNGHNPNAALSTSRHSRRVLRRGSVGGAVGSPSSNADASSESGPCPTRSTPSRTRSSHRRGSLGGAVGSPFSNPDASSESGPCPTRSTPNRTRSRRGSIGGPARPGRRGSIGGGEKQGSTSAYSARQLPRRSKSTRKPEETFSKSCSSGLDLGYGEQTDGETHGGRNLPQRRRSSRNPHKDYKQANHQFQKKYGSLGGSFSNLGVPSKEDLGYGDTEGETDCGSSPSFEIPSKEDLGYGDTEESLGYVKREEASKSTRQRMRRSSIGAERLPGGGSDDLDNKGSSHKSTRMRRTHSIAHKGAEIPSNEDLGYGDTEESLGYVKREEASKSTRQRMRRSSIGAERLPGGGSDDLDNKGSSHKSTRMRRTHSIAPEGAASNGVNAEQGLNAKSRHMRRTHSITHGGASKCVDSEHGQTGISRRSLHAARRSRSMAHGAIAA